MTQQLYELPTSTRARRQALALGFLLLLAFGLWAGACTAASAFAHATHYPPALGRPWLIPPAVFGRLTCFLTAGALLAATLVQRRWLLGPAALTLAVALVLTSSFPVYGPGAYSVMLRVQNDPQYGSVLSRALVWGYIAFSAPLLSLLPLLRTTLRLVRTGDLHGSARFASMREILESGFVVDAPSSDLTVSRDLPMGLVPQNGRERLLRVRGDVHVIAFAPPGSGKTTSFVIPTAQDWSGGLLVLDVKREVYQKTAGHRSAAGHRILVMDPSRDEPGLVHWNPLLAVRDFPEDVTDVSELALLLLPDHKGSDPFWRQSARALLEGIILHVLYALPEKTLAACYSFLCSPDQPVVEQFQSMLDTLHCPDGRHGWTTHPRVAMSARAFLDMPEQTRGGVVASCLAVLAPYADPILAAATSTSDFALADLFAGDRTTTLYLAIDPNSLQRLADHIRIVISQITAALTRDLPPPGRPPFLLLLDEFPAFGTMTVIERALAYLRGYGVQTYIVVQHLDQLHALYGQTESISPNCSVHIAFAPAHLKTAEALSRRAGTRTVAFERGSTGRGGTSAQQGDAGRPLLQPDEILRLPRDLSLILRVGTRPILVRPEPYFKNPLRLAASQIPAPPSEPTFPDLSRWTSRRAPAPPPKSTRGRRVERNMGLSQILGASK